MKTTRKEYHGNYFDSSDYFVSHSQLQCDWRNWQRQCNPRGTETIIF